MYRRTIADIGEFHLIERFKKHEELMKLGGVYADMYHRQRLADELGEIS